MIYAIIIGDTFHSTFCPQARVNFAISHANTNYSLNVPQDSTLDNVISQIKAKGVDVKTYEQALDVNMLGDFISRSNDVLQAAKNALRSILRSTSNNTNDNYAMRLAHEVAPPVEISHRENDGLEQSDLESAVVECDSQLYFLHDADYEETLDRIIEVYGWSTDDENEQYLDDSIPEYADILRLDPSTLRTLAENNRILRKALIVSQLI